MKKTITTRIDDFQLSLDVLELRGSDVVWSVDGYNVSFIEGTWGCTCDGFQKKYIKHGGDCRHILKKKLELATQRIEFLHNCIKDMEEGTSRHRKRGMGAHYGLKKIRDIDISILQILSQVGDGKEREWGVPRRYVRVKLAREYGIYKTDTAIGGRLSEMLGGLRSGDNRIPLLEMSQSHRVVVDEDGNYRFVEGSGLKKPLYKLSEYGWQLINSNFDIECFKGGA